MCAQERAQLNSVSSWSCSSPRPLEPATSKRKGSSLNAGSFYVASSDIPQAREVVMQEQSRRQLPQGHPVCAARFVSCVCGSPKPAKSASFTAGPGALGEPAISGCLLSAQLCHQSKNNCSCSFLLWGKEAIWLQIHCLGGKGCWRISQKQTCWNDKLVKNEFFPVTDFAIFPVTDACFTFKNSNYSN